MTDPNLTPAQFWDDLYGQRDRVWSGEPNSALVREASGLTPGTALDVGCGEGADVIWLALRGWRVTGVDVSHIALDRAAEQAAAAGVADRIDWQCHDLAVSFPAGTFDLVSAQFLHSYLELPRDDILRSAAAAVAPAGVLLIVGHAEHPHSDVHLPTTQEVFEALNLPTGQWELLVSEEHQHRATGPDGQTATRTNNTLKLRRHPA